MSGPGRAERITDRLWEESRRRWHDDPLFRARVTLALRVHRAHRRTAGPSAQAAREAACLALVVAEHDVQTLTAPSSDDVGTCRVCGRTIFRTNMDGRWHHPGAVTPEHDAVPEEDRRG